MVGWIWFTGWSWQIPGTEGAEFNSFFLSLTSKLSRLEEKEMRGPWGTMCVILVEASAMKPETWEMLVPF